ncbi:hypothetical protein EB001_18250 [bacterium]|nr:hypothetical protein [bacterium]
MGHQKLATYFKTNFSLMQHHHWNLTETENMIPWERQIYIDLLQDFLKKEEDRLKDLENERKSQLSSLARRKM